MTVRGESESADRVTVPIIPIPSNGLPDRVGHAANGLGHRDTGRPRGGRRSARADLSPLGGPGVALRVSTSGVVGPVHELARTWVGGIGEGSAAGGRRSARADLSPLGGPGVAPRVSTSGVVAPVHELALRSRKTLS